MQLLVQLPQMVSDARPNSSVRMGDSPKRW